MKTTIELPDATFRQAKALAAARGTTLKQFFTEALDEKLRRCARERNESETNEGEADPPWMAGFGALADLSSENRRINAVIEAEFEKLEAEDIG